MTNGGMYRSKDEAMSAVTRWGHALNYVSASLRSDKNVVLSAVSNNGMALEHASDELRNDKSIVLVAVKNSGRSLKYADQSMKSDKEVVLVAVKSDSFALEYASEFLKNDKEVVLSALLSHEEFRNPFVPNHPIEYASQEIRELCRDQDPISALRSAIYKEELELRLSHSSSAHRKSTKIKI